MISLKQRQKGFTIVELLIVIVVIGILAALVITTYSGIQAKARNAKRQTDVQDVQTQIEAFFSQQGYYPSNADLNSSAWRATNMKSLDPGAMTDPKSGTSTVADSQPSATTYQYWYIPKDSSGSSANCETTDTTCATYTLGANLESGSTYTKTNLD